MTIPKLSRGIGFVSLYWLLLLLPPEVPFAGAQSGSNSENHDLTYNRYAPPIAVIIVILVFAMFFMGCLSIYLRHFSGGSRSENSVLPVGDRHGARGLDLEVIEKFPVLEYSKVKVLKIGKGALECAVCLSEFEDDDKLRLIPKCDHVFHPECIDEWLASHTTCPVCRADLVPNPDDSVRQIPMSNDVEAQNEAADETPFNSRGNAGDVNPRPVEVEVMMLNQAMNGNRTRRSRSSRQRKFPRSHSTGHSISLVQPGEDTERYTLRLPAEVRKQILNPELCRSKSMVIFAREGSSRRGYRNSGEVSSTEKSWRWVISVTPPFLTRVTSVKCSNGDTSGREGSPTHLLPSFTTDSARPPV